MTLFTFQQLNLEGGLSSFSSGKFAINSDYIFFRINMEQKGIWFSKLNWVKDWCVQTINHELYINKNRLK